jgi:hypothetical protein
MHTNGVFPPIGKKFNGGKLHMPRDGHKESQFISIHDVDAESHFAIQQKDVRRSRRHRGKNMWFTSADCLPFEGGHTGPKDVLCSKNMQMSDRAIWDKILVHK